jgi:hypothetical protein
MSRSAKIAYFGVPGLVLALICLYECCVVAVGVGGVTVTATVHSETHRQIRNVTYGNFGRREDAESYLPYPPKYAEINREAEVKDGQSFSFVVPTSDRVSPFGLFRNQFYWRRFALFRIECDAGEPLLVAAEIPDVRFTKSITINIP